MKINKTCGINKLLISGIIWSAISLSVYPQSSIKGRKIEMGCHATYFFDDRGFQFGNINNYFPFGIIRSYAYLTTKNDFKSGFQFRLSEFHSVTRHTEYIQKRIFNKSFREVYGYTSVLYFKEIKKQKLLNSYLLLGLTHRDACDAIIIYALNDYWYENIESSDLGLSLGIRYEVNLPKNIYFYVQPLYNFYFFRTNKELLRNEIIGNFGLGYKFYPKKKKSK